MSLGAHFTLSKNQCPKTQEDIVKMSAIPPANIVGSVMYTMIITRLYLTFVISVLSRFMSKPSCDHLIEVKWVMSYIADALSLGLCYRKEHDSLDLVRFVDLDFAGYKDSRKSTTTYVFTL